MAKRTDTRNTEDELRACLAALAPIIERGGLLGGAERQKLADLKRKIEAALAPIPPETLIAEARILVALYAPLIAQHKARVLATEKERADAEAEAAAAALARAEKIQKAEAALYEISKAERARRLGE